jgi:hypothetical protein
MKKVLFCSKNPTRFEQATTEDRLRLPASSASCWVCPEEKIKIAAFRSWITEQAKDTIKGPESLRSWGQVRVL